MADCAAEIAGSIRVASRLHHLAQRHVASCAIHASASKHPKKETAKTNRRLSRKQPVKLFVNNGLRRFITVMGEIYLGVPPAVAA